MFDYLNSLPSGIGDFITLVGFGVFVYLMLFAKGNIDHWIETRGQIKIAMYNAKKIKYLEQTAEVKLEKAKVLERTAIHNIELARIEMREQMR